MRIKDRKLRWSALVALTAFLVVATAAVALADQVVNNIDTTIDSGLETMTISAGGSAHVGFYIQPSNEIPSGDASGCNATGANPATVNLSVPAGVTATPSIFTIVGCGDTTDTTQIVTFSSSTSGSYTITVASVTGGKSGSLWSTAPAQFTLVVNSAAADTTPPVITPNVTGTLGNNGWYVSDVTVTWTVTDPESTVTSTTGCDPTTIDNDTAGVTLTCSATSAGGTNSQSVTIKRDATAPNISGSASPAANGDGWSNTDVTVSFTCGDATSDVASCTAPVTLSSEGAGQSVTGTAVDNAGNSASATVSGTNIDKTAPSVVYTSASPSPNGDGWYNTDVTATFTATDSLSGFPGPSTTKTGTETTSGEGTAVTVGSPAFTDLAGNFTAAGAATSEPFKIDKTAPTASASASPAPNANGWNNTNVTVSFSGNDGLSGIASCSAPVVLSSEGAGQSASGTCTDVAGNVSNLATASDINIDKTPPTVSVTGVSDGGEYILGSVPLVGCSAASDALSGVASTGSESVSGGNANGVGAFTASCSATDNAGNTGTASVRYSVLYGNVSGILQPINPDNTSVFKRGQAVPVKFRLGGDEFSGFVTSSWSIHRQVVACNAFDGEDAVLEAVPSNAPSASFRYDSSADQYIYNADMRTGVAGSCYNFKVTLDSGQVLYSAIFKLAK